MRICHAGLIGTTDDTDLLFFAVVAEQGYFHRQSRHIFSQTRIEEALSTHDVDRSGSRLKAFRTQCPPVIDLILSHLDKCVG